MSNCVAQIDSADSKRFQLGHVDAVRGRHGAAVLKLVAKLRKDLLERRKENQHVRLATGVAHQADPPDLALERSEAGADFDVEPIQKSLPHGRIINARRNSDRIELRQRVPGLRGATISGLGSVRATFEP